MGEGPTNTKEGLESFRFSLFPLLIMCSKADGGIAQLARASALQAEGQGFESPCLQAGMPERAVFDSISVREEVDNMVKREQGPRRMPGSRQTRKDVASCEKPGGGANIPRSRGLRMG